MNTKTTLFGTLLLISCTTYPIPDSHQPGILNKTIGYITGSYPVYLVEKYACTPFYNALPGIDQIFGNEPASPEYQTLATEAQNAHGIPLDRHVPIKKIPTTSPIASSFGGQASPGVIYINENRLDQYSYGARRFALFHEAAHVKYNDQAANLLIECVGWPVFTALLYRLCKYLRPTGGTKRYLALSALIGSIPTGMLGSYYQKLMERRADVLGLQALQCAQCAQESADYRRKRFEQKDDMLRASYGGFEGYLQANEIEQFVAEFKEQNLCCSYHQHHKTIE